MSDQDDQEATSSSDDDDLSSASETFPAPRMKSTVPVFGTGTTRTVLDMPLRGSKDAPKLFRGHHAEVEYFIAHYDRLLVKFHVNDPHDQCKLILDYCSTDVQGFIRASKYYQNKQWPKLRREILQSYDADRATSRYKPSDIATYTLKTQSKPFQNLSQWKKYFIKYKTMAGILLQQGHITQVNYDVYFWLGIQIDLRRTLEQRINQLNPTRSSRRQYSVREINIAAEWYFRRNRAEAMVVNAADYGVDLDSGTTEAESEDESDDSDDSDYEAYRRKHRAKARAKKAKEKKKAKKSSSAISGTRVKTLQTTGTAEERGLDAHWYTQNAENDDEDLPDGEVFLTVPRGQRDQPGDEVLAAERTVPSTRAARREVFDGVHVPRRERSGPDHVTGPEKSPDPKGKSRAADLPIKKARDTLPELIPVDARTPRTDVDVDMEPSPQPEPRPPNGPRSSGPASNKQSSDIQNTVQIPSIIERILDLTIPLSVRETLVASKEIRAGILDTIRLKNVKAVLLGDSRTHPIAATWNWPRSDGVLIKVDVETNVRDDIAALKIQRPVDMTMVTNMNDANGGRGQLRGHISNVDINCGGVATRTDLWMSHQAPFELLLGRPWQRGNLVTIDERDEGTYLVFKDHQTRLPRYELLAIPDSTPFPPINPPPAVPNLEDSVPGSLGKDPKKTRHEASAPPRHFWNPFWAWMQQFGLYPALVWGIFLVFSWISWSKTTPCPTRNEMTRYEERGDKRTERTNGDLPPILSFASPPHSVTPRLNRIMPPNSTPPPYSFSTPTFPSNRYDPLSRRPPRHNDNSPNPSPNRPRHLPFAPIPCGALSREREHVFGREDRLPRFGNVLSRIQAATNAEWRNHRTGNALTIRPGSIVAPQTFYTGHETRANGQELYHAIFLNARMLIHNPATGLPAWRNGHCSATLVAAPSGNQPWSFETAYPTDPELHQSLPMYGPNVHAEVGRQCREGQHQMCIDRRIEPASDDIDMLVDANPSALIPRASAARTPLLTTIPLPAAGSQRPLLTTAPLSRYFSRRPLASRLPFAEHLSPTARRFINEQPSTAPSELFRETTYHYLTHPPHLAPRVDISSMTYLGIAADTGHCVLRFPTCTLIPGLAEAIARPGTPGLPFRLLDEPPQLVDESAASSDDSMPLAQSSSSENSDHEAGLQSTTRLPPLRPYLESNARLERLQLNAGRCGTADLRTDADAPKLVCSAFYTPAAVAQEAGGQFSLFNSSDVPRQSRTLPEEDSDSGLSSGPPDLISATDLSRISEVESSEASHYFSPSLSSVSLLDTPAPDSSQPPAPANGVSSSSPRIATLPSRTHTPYPPDCRSTVQSPRPSLFLRDRSVQGSIPELSDVSEEDEDESGDEPTLYTLPSFASILANDRGRRIPQQQPLPVAAVNKGVLRQEFERIARAPPSPELEGTRTWAAGDEWSRTQAAFLVRVREHEDDRYLAAAHRAIHLVNQAREVLDHARMSRIQLVDLDTDNLERYPDFMAEGHVGLIDRVSLSSGSSSSTSESSDDSEQIQRLNDAVDAYDEGFPDGTPICDIRHVLVSADGKRFRQLSEYALAQDLMYRYALKIIAISHPDWITLFTQLRVCGMSLVDDANELFRRRRWEVERAFLHKRAHTPPPYLKGPEYGKLRLAAHTFALHGHTEVADTIDELLRFRFKEEEILTHLLYAGLFDPNDIIFHDEGPESSVHVARRHAAAVPRASFDFKYLFLDADIPPKENRRLAAKYARNWAQASLRKTRRSSTTL
ncbi:hypothetical protein C8R47DRAFT_1294284 [Mycena vitilis]|nr:hypothetical protein C8R47DRAFT_1294284 [Mycena vitilis]